MMCTAMNIVTLVSSSVMCTFCFWTNWFTTYLPGWTSWNFNRKISENCNIFLHVINFEVLLWFKSKLNFHSGKLDLGFSSRRTNWKEFLGYKLILSYHFGLKTTLENSNHAVKISDIFSGLFCITWNIATMFWCFTWTKNSTHPYLMPHFSFGKSLCYWPSIS